MLKTDLLTHTEVGIDPIKYAIITKIDSFIVSWLGHTNIRPKSLMI